jgi:hypothetical protein
VLGNGKAVCYPVDVGQADKQWTGTAMIKSDKPLATECDSGRQGLLGPAFAAAAAN